jgi:hypothetical protein
MASLISHYAVSLRYQHVSILYCKINPLICDVSGYEQIETLPYFCACGIIQFKGFHVKR